MYDFPIRDFSKSELLYDFTSLSLFSNSRENELFHSFAFFIASAYRDKIFSQAFSSLSETFLISSGDGFIAEISSFIFF